MFQLCTGSVSGHLSHPQRKPAIHVSVRKVEVNLHCKVPHGFVVRGRVQITKFCRFLSKNVNCSYWIIVFNIKHCMHNEFWANFHATHLLIQIHELHIYVDGLTCFFLQKELQSLKYRAICSLRPSLLQIRLVRCNRWNSWRKPGKEGGKGCPGCNADSISGHSHHLSSLLHTNKSVYMVGYLISLYICKIKVIGRL